MSSEREQQNLKNLELGGVPFFVANLSVNELSLMGKAGYHPAGQVMGSTIYHVGWQFGPQSLQYNPKDGLMVRPTVSAEQEVLTGAHLQARDLALSRLQWETRLLGAHGVVGVRLERKSYDWAAGLIEFSVIGTAIRINGEPPTDTPFLSDLSGEEFYQLWQAGYKPVAFAYGSCFWYQVAGQATWVAQNVVFGGINNQELTDFSHAVKQARDLAMGRMEKECLAAGASGVVGVKVERQLKTVEADGRGTNSGQNQRTDLTVRMEVTGTAIARRKGTFNPPASGFAVSLLDLTLRGAARD
jgi:uncharacterized protein YbjQ (UPF0145 family)